MGLRVSKFPSESLNLCESFWIFYETLSLNLSYWWITEFYRICLTFSRIFCIFRNLSWEFDWVSLNIFWICLKLFVINTNPSDSVFAFSWFVDLYESLQISLNWSKFLTKYFRIFLNSESLWITQNLSENFWISLKLSEFQGSQIHYFSVSSHALGWVLESSLIKNQLELILKFFWKLWNGCVFGNYWRQDNLDL